MATLDLTKAIQHLRSHAHKNSIHLCATYVKQALAAGGLPYLSGSDGVDVGAHYEKKYGFKRVNLKQNGKNFIGMVAGDICSISVKHHNKGHACMYDGYQWISDFKQNSCIPYNMNTVNWARVWRWKDIPGDFNVPKDDNSVNGEYSSNTNSGSSGGNNNETNATSLIIVPNQYPTHSEYTTYTGSGGNIFETAEKNKMTFKSAAISENENSNVFTNEEIEGKIKRTRIYSTNDSCIVLDSLRIKTDENADDDTWANKNITQADVDKHNDELKKNDEQTNNSSTNSSSNT